MITTYEEYRQLPKALPFEQMNELHRQITTEIAADADALELYDDLIAVSSRYAMIRASWLSLNREEKMEQDPGRTSCHDSVIIHLNMLSRYLLQKGKAAAWRDSLGYEEDDPYNRKAIGDFACYLVFINSINAR